MSVDLIRKIIKYHGLMGEASGQTMVEGDVVPDEKNPEIGEILYTGGRITITGNEVNEDIMTVQGKMNFEILYSSLEKDGGIYRIEEEAPFSHNMNITGARPGLSGSSCCEIEHIESEIITGKRARVSAIISINGKVGIPLETEAVTDISGNDVELLRENVDVNEFVMEGSGKTLVSGGTDISQTEGEIRKILKSSYSVHNKTAEIKEGKAYCSASVHMCSYCDTADGKLYTAEYDVPFTSEIENEKLKEGMRTDIDFLIGEVRMTVKENQAGERKRIESEFAVETTVRVYDKASLNSISDGYSHSERLEFERERINSVFLYDVKEEKIHIKERISVSEVNMPLSDVMCLIPEIGACELKIMENRAAVEGNIRCTLIYSPSSQEEGFHSHIDEIPFKIGMDIPGARIDMTGTKEVGISEISLYRVNEREIDVGMTIDCGIKLFSRSSFEILKNVSVSEIDESERKRHSLVIYIVQPNDTLWKVAKKYNAAIEDITLLNHIDNPEVLAQDTKILIPVRSYMKKPC